MYRRFHDRFGTAGVVIAVIALVAALGGTAIAAGGLTGKQKKAVTKIAKKYAGQDGAPGATGPAGLAGTNGTNGKDGKDGANGTNGTNGSNGVSAEGVAFGPTEEPVSEPCAGLGGVEVKSASPEPSYVCNGEEGSPWTAGGVLPSGATETGTWYVESEKRAALSFPIPLAASLTGSKVKVNDGAVAEGTLTAGSPTVTIATVFQGTFTVGALITGTGIPAGTTITAVSLPTLTLSQNATSSGAGVFLSEGGVPECDNGAGNAASIENPEADKGFLCLFSTGLAAPLASPFQSSTSGFIIKYSAVQSEGAGSFAVTAP